MRDFLPRTLLDRNERVSSRTIAFDKVQSQYEVCWSRLFAAVMSGNNILVTQGTRQGNMLYVNVVSELVSQSTCARMQRTVSHIYMQA